MNPRLSFALVNLASALTLSASPSFATNGYFSHAASTAQKGTAGAGVAHGGDILSLSTNPASLIQAKSGWEVGAALFSPSRDYASNGLPSAVIDTTCSTSPCPFSIGDGNQNIKSKNAVFAVPQFAVAWQIDDSSALAFSVLAHGGMNSKYQGGSALLPNAQSKNVQLDGTYGNGTTGVDLAQMFLGLTYAKQFAAQNVSVGISGFMAYQTFEATGLGNFAGFSSDPSKLTNNGTDSASGFGVRIGLQFQPSANLSFGASYQPQIKMNKFNDYSGLFAQQGRFDIPATWVLGTSYAVNNSAHLLFDVQHIAYADTAAVGNPINPLLNGSCTPSSTGGDGAGCLGAHSGAGFGWSNMTVYKLGYEWSNDNVNTWRVGYSKAEQPIPSSELLFAILAPGVIEQHFTLGFGRKIDSNSHFDLSLMYAPEKSVSGVNNFDPGQTITVKMSQVELAATYSVGF